MRCLVLETFVAGYRETARELEDDFLLEPIQESIRQTSPFELHASEEDIHRADARHVTVLLSWVHSALMGLTSIRDFRLSPSPGGLVTPESVQLIRDLLQTRLSAMMLERTEWVLLEGHRDTTSKLKTRDLQEIKARCDVVFPFLDALDALLAQVPGTPGYAEAAMRTGERAYKAMTFLFDTDQVGDCILSLVQAGIT